MIQGHHDCHLLEKFLMFRFFKLRFFNSFGSTVDSSVPGFNFMNTSKATSPNLFKYGIIFQIILFPHLDERIPFNFDGLDDLKLLNGNNGWLFLDIILNLHILSLLRLNIDLLLFGLFI